MAAIEIQAFLRAERPSSRTRHVRLFPPLAAWGEQNPLRREDVTTNADGLSLSNTVDAWWLPGTRSVLMVSWRVVPARTGLAFARHHLDGMHRKFASQQLVPVEFFLTLSVDLVEPGAGDGRQKRQREPCGSLGL